MQARNKSIEKQSEDNSFFTRVDFRERRRLEMKRRIGLLHHKRKCLERELLLIKDSLIALDAQIQRDHSFKKLSQ